MTATGSTGRSVPARRRELFLFVLLVVGLDAKYLWSWCHRDRMPHFGDPTGIRSHGKLAVRGDPATPHDVASLSSCRHALAPMSPGALPFFCPSTVLLLLALLGLMGPVAARMF